MGTVLGPVAGAFLLIILIELGANIMGAIGGANIIYGIALVLIIILEPKGVLHMLEKMTQRIGKMLKQRSSQK